MHASPKVGVDLHVLHRDAVEDLATAAIKEEGIEAKLAAIALEWGDVQLTFQDYKTRGAVVLKARMRFASTRMHDAPALKDCTA